jgi:hypothetical protein
MMSRITTCLNVTVGNRCATALCLMLFFLTHPAVAADRVSDELLTRYVVSILDRELHWERDSYIPRIVNGVATITLLKDDPVQRV